MSHTTHHFLTYIHTYVYGRYILLFYARLFLHKSLHIRRVIYIVSHSNNIKIYFRHIFFHHFYMSYTRMTRTHTFSSFKICTEVCLSFSISVLLSHVQRIYTHDIKENLIQTHTFKQTWRRDFLWFSTMCVPTYWDVVSYSCRGRWLSLSLVWYLLIFYIC